jgi:benzoyl-CoA-dihydrodiol lyase
VFCTLAEGIKGKRAVDWGLVDAVLPRSRFAAAVDERALAFAGTGPRGEGSGVVLEPINGEYRHVTLDVNDGQRSAVLTVLGPAEIPAGLAEIRRAGSDFWPLRAFRELDDALLRLRFEHEEIAVVVLKTQGDLEMARRMDELLDQFRADWFVNEVLLLIARTLRRLDLTAHSFFAAIDRGSCFAGSLLEVALAADRIYMLRDDEGEVRIATTALNAGTFPMSHGISRLEARFLPQPPENEPMDADQAEEAGLATMVLDDIDWDDELRVAIEERASLSPDALTGLEANLRFPGCESADSKVFGRLSAWQNWIFSRPNATGPRGALSLYGKPERPQFDRRRT